MEINMSTLYVLNENGVYFMIDQFVDVSAKSFSQEIGCKVFDNIDSLYDAVQDETGFSNETKLKGMNYVFLKIMEIYSVMIKCVAMKKKLIDQSNFLFQNMLYNIINFKKAP